MRISDWSSDVCSSDLADAAAGRGRGGHLQRSAAQARAALCRAAGARERPCDRARELCRGIQGRDRPAHQISVADLGVPFDTARRAVRRVARSEEHTSELQSLMRISYAVFCLKKKKTV